MCRSGSSTGGTYKTGFAMNKPYRVCLETLLIGLLAYGVPGVAAEFATPAATYPGQNGLYKAEQMSKASSSLVRVVQEHRAHIRQAQTALFRPSDQFLRYHAGRVLIDAMAFGDGAALLQDLKRLGLINGVHFGNAVSGMLPVAAIEKAVALDILRSISASLTPINTAGSIISQGDVALRTDVARPTYAVDGTGVTVGVLSDSFNSLGGAAQDISTGDLPASGVTVVGGESQYCGTFIFCIDEGRAMLQIVHDMAPGADLLFHQALDGKAAYAAAITTLAGLGADVIVDDLMYLNEPMFQDGIVAQAVDSVVAGGSAYYSAAGNAGRESYEAPFSDSGVIFCIEFFLPIGDCDPIYERVGRMHDFDPGVGVDLYQSVTVPVGSRLIVAMQWDEPFGGPGAKIDHDIVLLDETGKFYFEISANDNVTTGEGWEVLQFENYEFLGYGSLFNIVITYDDVDSRDLPATLLKTVIFGSGVTLNDFATNSGTLIGHANAAGAAAVGAAFFNDTPEYGTTPPVLEPYSSAGGVPVLFSANGSSLASPEVRLKPDITAVDGVNTTFFFADLYGNDGVDDFFGTSAAAPHAAGIAALMLQAKPGAAPAQLNAALKQTAIDMGTAGFDFDSGYGLIQADAAVAEIITTSIIISPVAAFAYACTGSGCSFDGSLSTDDIAVTSYTWDFGDGAGSMEQSPTHTYAIQGNYTVTLVVTDADFASDTASAAFRVKRKGETSGSSDGGGTLEAEKGRKKCTDGIDNDGDGLTDGADPDCNR